MSVEERPAQVVDDVVRETFTREGSRRRYHDGMALFVEGDPPGTVFAILSGEVVITAGGVGGRDLVLNRCDAGELLGEVSAIDGLPRSATATAVGDVEVTVLPAGRFNRLLEAHPPLALAVLRYLADRVRTSTVGRVRHEPGDPMTTVATGLVRAADRGGAVVGALVRVAVTQTEVAGWLGGDREAGSRVLAGLEGEGWVEVDADGIDLVNLPALRRLAAARTPPVPG